MDPRFNEMFDRGLDVIGRFDELDAGPVEHDPFLQLADVAVGDAPLDDDRAFAEGDAEIVQRVELQCERGFDLGAAAAHVQDRHRLEDLHLAIEG